MINLLIAAFIYIAGEIAAIGLFWQVRKHYAYKSETPNSAIIAGMLERFVIFTGLYMGVTQILAMFGALKIGTRVNKDKDDKKTSEYFVVGNLLSVLLALAYNWIYIRLHHH